MYYIAPSTHSYSPAACLIDSRGVCFGRYPPSSAMDGRGPYGKACQNCANGKIKCVPSTSGGCQRCRRLNKPCQPINGVRISRDTRSIHQRLGQIESLLKSLVHPQTPSTQSSKPTPPPRQSGYPSSQTNSTPTPQLPAATIPYELPGDRDAQEALEIFRGRMLRLCPFVYLPPSLTAQQMQQERPFLFETMLAVTTHSVQEKIARGSKLKETLAMAMVVENESNIDLLLGILTYVAWGYDQHLTRKPTLSRLMVLAVSIIGSLHLNKPAPASSNTLTLFGGSHSWPKTNYSTINALEEKRAVLGCFLLASLISSYYGEMEPMRWTEKMESYLKEVEGGLEWAGDAALVTHIRLQRLAQQARQIRDEREPPTSVPFFLASFRPQLETVRKSIPMELSKDDWIIGHLHYVELTIHEMAYSAHDAFQASTATPFTVSPIGKDAISCMEQSLQAIQVWWSVFFKFSSDDIVLFTMVQWIQFAQALVTLFRLTTHPAPDWDNNTVRTRIDILEIMDHAEALLGEICPENGGAFPDDIFSRLRLLARAMRSWTLLSLENTPAEPQPQLEPGTGPAQTLYPVSGPPLVGDHSAVPGWNVPQAIPPLFQYNYPAWVVGPPAQSPPAGMQF
ncbi:hypothetical protein BDV11DRAFT_198746 [Aspergillus similis]